MREDLKSHELKFYKSYIDDFRILIPITMGLTLRKLESSKDYDRIDKLRSRIMDKYGVEGVHVAQTVQNGIIIRYVTYLMEIHSSELIMRKLILSFFENIELRICFVTNFSEIEREVEKIITRLNAHSPEVFIISGMGQLASSKAEEIIKIIDSKNFSNYFREDYSRVGRRVAFFHKILEQF